MKNTKTKPEFQHVLLMTAKQMSIVCGIGENRLRKMMDDGELEYLQVGSHRLICENAIWDYYNRAKTTAKTKSAKCIDAVQALGA